MSKSKATAPKEESLIHTSQAVQKVGEQDTTFTESEVETKYDSLVDLIRNLNKQLVTLSQRCDVLEKQNNIKPTKKKGTMPLSEVGEPSFSTEE